MKITLEKVDIYKLVGKALSMDLTDANVTVRADPLELSITGVSPDVVPTPVEKPSELEVALLAAVEEIKTTEPKEPVEPDEPENLFDKMEQNNTPMSLEGLRSPPANGATPPRKSKTTAGYVPPPLGAALKMSTYFVEEAPDNLGEHFDDPGLTTVKELSATKGKVTEEELTRTRKMIDDATKAIKK